MTSDSSLLHAGVLLIALGAMGALSAEAQSPSEAAQLLGQFDADQDGFYDQLESALGSSADDADETPESHAISGACQDGIDNDGDGSTDGADPGCAIPEIFGQEFPAASGFDVFPSDLDTDLDELLGQAAGFGMVRLTGPTVVSRAQPQSPGGVRQFTTEITAMQLTGKVSVPGTDDVFSIVIIEDPDKSSTGWVKAKRTSDQCLPDEICDYPASSEFSVHFRVFSPSGILSKGPFKMTNDGVNFIPPIARGNPCYMFAGGSHLHCPGGNMVSLTVAKVHAAKFVCVDEVGPAGGAVKHGNYRTVVNIHNPTDAQAEFTKKAVIDLPENEPPIPPSGRHLVELPPDYGVGVDCGDIADLLGAPMPLGNGFLIVESPHKVKLDVVAVYTQKVEKNKILFQLEMPEKIIPDLPFPLAKKLEVVVEVHQDKVLDPEELVRGVLRKELAEAGFNPGLESAIQVKIHDVELGVGSSIDVESIKAVKVSPRKVKAQLPPPHPPSN